MMFNERYKIISNLGQGGFGETFLAEDTNMPSRRRCVIKRLKPQFTNSDFYEVTKKRFAREAAVLETLGEHHSQIPRLYGYFEEELHFYLVQELIEGEPWNAILKKRNQLPEPEVKQLLADILPVLDYIHSQGIIHRDIKLSNIICRASDGKPVLIDFGAVKEKLTNSDAYSVAVGTPGYMAPEQVSGQPVPASDLYSLGLSAITLVTGLYPSLLEQDTSGKYSWRSEAENISVEFADFLEKAVHPDLEQRFNTAQEMLIALGNLKQEVALAPKNNKRFSLGDPQLWKSTLQSFFSLQSGVVMGQVAGLTTIAVIALRLLGWLQPYELQAFDLLMRQRRPYESPDQRLLIVEATADDIANQKVEPRNQASLSDATLTQVFQKLQKYEPVAIGLDIYRDFPVNPKTPQLKQFLQQKNFFGICKTRDPAAGDTQGIAPPPELPRNQVTYSDVITDPDGVLRRHLLSQQPPDLSDPCSATNHLSFIVALYYLNQQGIEWKTNAKGEFVLYNPQSEKEVHLQPLKSHTGGYQTIDTRGRQILLNYRNLRSPENIAHRISIGDLLNDRIPPETKERLKNRIVFVGIVSPVNASGDYWLTPYSPAQPLRKKKTLGLYLQAHMTSQILSATLDNRPLLWAMPWWLEWIWIGSWSALTTVAVWYARSPRQRVGLTIVIIGSWYGTCYLFMLQGGWMPFLPSAIAAVICAITVGLIRR